MSDINVVTLRGRVDSAPQIRTFQHDNKIATFSVSTSAVWHDRTTGKQREKVYQHRIQVHGAADETGPFGVVKSLKKGLRLQLQGTLEYFSWQDKSGRTCYGSQVSVRPAGGEIVLIDDPAQTNSVS